MPTLVTGNVVKLDDGLAHVVTLHAGSRAWLRCGGSSIPSDVTGWRLDSPVVTCLRCMRRKREEGEE